MHNIIDLSMFLNQIFIQINDNENSTGSLHDAAPCNGVCILYQTYSLRKY